MTRAKGARGSAPNPAGAAPLRPEHKTVLMKEKSRGPERPPVGRASGSRNIAKEKTLAQIDSGGLEQIQILSAGHIWPVLK